MNIEVADSRSAESNRPATSPAVRWLLGIFLTAAVAVLLAIVSAALFALRMWVDDRAAAQAVKAEVARLRAAGQPMTSDDLYGAHQPPVGVPDATPAWLAALKSFDPVQLNKDAKGLAYVGDGDPLLLRPDGGDSQLVAAEQFLTTYASTLDAIRAAAKQPGECRYPVKFEQGFAAVTNSVNEVRTLVRLLSLDVHVQAIRGNADKALESLAALFAASDAVSHQFTIVEQLVHFAALSRALAHTELVLNELQLTDAQLAGLAQRIEACDIQGSFTHSLVGERAMAYQEFSRPMGVVPRSADCQKHLEVMTEVISFSKLPLPTGRQNMQSLFDKIQTEQRTARPWNKNRYLLTAQLLPALATTFDAYAKIVAYRDMLVTAIAAERYRLKNSDFPAQLADLVPDYLAAVPSDPFDGQPLRLRTTESGIVIYSVGKDEKDDGAVNPPGNSHEPDIIVRLSASKARSP